MGNTNSDQLEELLYRAHRLDIFNELNDRVCKLPTKTTPVNILERYETCFRQIVEERSLQ
jgi:hypothetical protein